MPTSDLSPTPAHRPARARERASALARIARIGAVLPACAALLGCEPGAGARSPDVCLLLVDTLRADHLGLYGYPRETSPSLDAFAAASVVFEDVVAPSSWTMPSVGSLMTSTYPSVHGMRTRTGDASTTALRPQLPTLAEAFRQAGYRTVALVTNPWTTPGYGFERGFDEYQLFRMDVPASALDFVARQALDSGDPRPVFLYVHYMDVHGPYDAAPRLPPEALGPIPAPLDRAMTVRERRSVPGYLRLDRSRRLGAYVHAYDSGIRMWDLAFGAWLSWLATSGRADHTIVSVTADHGEELLDHGGWNHGTNLHQESIWIPWILRVPGRPPERVADRTVSLLDVGPTLLAAAGAPIPDTMDGVDALAGAPASRDVFSETEVRIGGFPDVPRKAVRRGSRKLIRNADRETCYDLSRDPGEQQPLADDAACRAELGGALDAWQRAAAERADALGPVTESPLDASAREQLEALGYAR